jgi:hypothetical protein
MERIVKRRILLVAIAVVALIGSGLFLKFRTFARLKPDIAASGGFRLIFRPDRDEKIHRPFRITAIASPSGHLPAGGTPTPGAAGPTPPSVSSVTVYYRKAERKEWTPYPLQYCPKSDLWAGSLPPLPKGKRYFYYLEVRGSRGEKLFLPEGAPEAPGQGFYHVTYEGHVSEILLIAHIVLACSTAVFLLHAFYYGLCQLVCGDGYRGAYWCALAGNLLFFISMVPLGAVLSGQTFGEPWGAWPLGTDVTDTKSQFLFLFWLVAALLQRKTLTGGRRGKDTLSPRGFSILTVGGCIFSLVIFLIPHSYFFQ